MKIQKISSKSVHFPENLRRIPDSPGEIYVIGSIDLLHESNSLAVVGSRKVTPYGRGVTEDLVSQIAAKGIVIISGLALGVDAIAHKAALDAGGRTIAVLPCGLDKPYPSTNRQLAKRILEEGGTLISEYPESTPPLRPHFIARNRLVSGLSSGVLITEAAEKSGTLHTAGFALDQGKTVMAVPGNITSNLSRGTNNLIKTGASVVTSAQDIFNELGIGEQLEIVQTLAANAEEEAIIQLLKEGITEGNLLLSHSKLDAITFNQTLTMMEITGKIRSTGANHWTIC